MITLAYLSHQLSDNDFYQSLGRFFLEIISYKNAIIFANQSLHLNFSNTLVYPKFEEQEICLLDYANRDNLISCYPRIHMEDLAIRKLKNIFLVDFNYLPHVFLQNLITIKSKSCHIIGVSNTTHPSLKRFSYDLAVFKKMSMTRDEMGVYLALKNHTIDFVNEMIDYYDNVFSKIDYIEIDKVSDVGQYFKSI